jgi:hypothetical protein
MFVGVRVDSGLGNRLFQLAFLLFIAELLHAQPVLTNLHLHQTHHSSQNYYDTIFKQFNLLRREKPTRIYQENFDLGVHDWNALVDKRDDVIEFRGFFQHWVYVDGIRDKFLSMLDFSLQESLLDKYPDISQKTFVHIRGGDYIDNLYNFTKHFVNLELYYKRCQDHCPGHEFVIFTNDLPYATHLIRRTNLFPGAVVIQEDELGSLFLMSKCNACICANSTFSWWAAYLNKNRTIFLPSHFFTNPAANCDGYFFPEAIKIDCF